MDQRKHKQQSVNVLPPQFQDQILDKQDQVLPINQIANDYKYLDAIIFNLSERIEIGEKLQEMYANRQQQMMNQQGIPKQLRYYIHSPYILPIFGFSLVFMKFRKTLTLQKSALLLCGLSAFNEMAKYQKCQQMDQQLSEAYNEHAKAYNELLTNLMSVMTFKDMMKQLFSIDFNKDQLQSPTHYDQNAVDQFNMSFFI